jgi:hypothetical protein
VIETPNPTPADRLTDLSHRLSEGAEAWRSGEGPWLPAPLIAMIVAFIGDIAEALKSLAALLREGKLDLQPQSAPQESESESRAAGQPTHRPQSLASRRPAKAANRPVRANPEMAEMPATAPRPTRVEHPAPQVVKWQAMPPHHPTPHATPPPIPKTAWNKPAPWHAHNVTISKQ